MINENWSRWLFASMSIHFQDHKQNVPLYIEGEVRPTNVNEFAEFRHDGPIIREFSRNNYHIEVNPAILIQTIQDDQDFHKLDRHIGIFTRAFTNSIDIYEFGDMPIDSGAQLGCLVLTSEVRVNKFGQILAGMRVAQASIEAVYTMKL